MKTIKYFALPLAALMTLGMVTTSCNDDDKYFEDDAQDTPITVKQIYLEDYKSSVPDRAVDFARLGQMIRIEGTGLYGMKKVIINGYDTYFNRAYVTDNSLIVSINRETPVADCDPALRDKIRLVKDGAEYTYDFVIRSGYSTISSMSNTMPMPGESVTVNGANLYEVTKVTLPGGVEVTEGIEADAKDGKYFTFTMPAGVTEGGAIVVESPNGNTESPAFFNRKDGILVDFDTEGLQGAWSWKETGSMISNKVEDGDLVADPAGTGRGYCAQLVPDRLLNAEGGVQSGKPRVTEIHSVGDGNKDWEDWSRFSAFIPAETPVTEVAFQFDIYCPEPWVNTGYMQLQLINNYNFSGIGTDDDGKNNLIYCMVPWLETFKGGAIIPFQTQGWQTITVPLSDFNKYATLVADAEAQTPTFQMVIDDRLAATYPNFGMGFVNNDFTFKDAAGEEVELKSTAFTGPKIYVDNWRIVPYKMYEPSDYEEPETEE